MSVADRFLALREQLKSTALACGRSPESVTLVAVCKKQPMDSIVEAVRAGATDLGENTVQGLLAAQEALDAQGLSVRWHFIGRLQRNKINALLPHLSLLHTLETIEIAQALAQRTSKPLDVLVQVNIGKEPQKGGVPPEDVLAFCQGISGLHMLKLKGLMAIPPAEEDPVPYFKAMQGLSAQLLQQPWGKDAVVLSMGMSSDFPQAIAHGATYVRVGTQIFGERQKNVP